MSVFKLYMHAGKRGEAEKMRFLLNETGLKYDDVAVDETDFKDMCDDGTLKFNELPALEFIQGDGPNKYIEGSNACMRAIADWADSKKCGRGEALYAGSSDIRGNYESSTFIVQAIAERATHFERLANTVNPENAPENIKELTANYFQAFQDELSETDGDDVRTNSFLTGTNLTYADMTVFAAVNAVATNASLGGLAALKGYPKLKEFHDKIAAMARVESRIISRE